eukprot:COSAG02_NODE_319_length_24795_cov_20.998502_15_plen_39_part_00
MSSAHKNDSLLAMSKTPDVRVTADYMYRYMYYLHMCTT